MRSLERDKRLVLVSFYVEKRACVDDEGRLTGRHEVVRTEPMPLLCTVSASKGTAENSAFGIDLDYDRTLVIDDPDYPIDEASVLWIDNVPEQEPSAGEDEAFGRDLSGGRPHDYTVTRVARSQNCVAVAAKRVEVRR